MIKKHGQIQADSPVLFSYLNYNEETYCTSEQPLTEHAFS